MIGLCPQCGRWFKALSPGMLQRPWTTADGHALAVHRNPTGQVCRGSGLRVTVERLSVPAPYYDARSLR